MKNIILSSLIIVSLCSCEEKAGIDPQPQNSFSCQFPLEEYRISQEFCNYYEASNIYHAGEDGYGAGGTPVYAIADGNISYSGTMSGYGWLITIDHSDLGVYSLYGHLSTARDKKLEGNVKKGERIGYLADDLEDGSGGPYADWGPHLHFGIRKGKISDYPSDASENRWMAGLIHTYPPDLNWLNPSVYINEHSR